MALKHQLLPRKGGCEYVCMCQMFVSYTACRCPEVSICSVPGFPAVAMAVEARHGFNEFGRSAQGRINVGNNCMIEF